MNLEHYTTKKFSLFPFSSTWWDLYLFLFRSASPRHGFTIMNRLSMENRTEPITKDLDFQLQDPFLLYRNARCKYVTRWVKYWSQVLFSLFLVQVVQVLRLQLPRVETEGMHFAFLMCWKRRIARCSLRCHSAEGSVRMSSGVISSFNWQIWMFMVACMWWAERDRDSVCVFFLNIPQSVLGSLSVLFVVLIFCIKIDKCSQSKPCVLLPAPKYCSWSTLEGRLLLNY